MSLKSRFNNYTNKTDSCWIWTGLSIWNGYGRIWVKGKPKLAHRVSMFLYKDFDLNSDKLILHKPECNNRKCVNPDHLYIGDHNDNMRDKAISKTNHQSNKTHCPKGHEYTPENTYIVARGERCCKTCYNKRNRDNQRRLRIKRKIKGGELNDNPRENNS